MREFGIFAFITKDLYSNTLLNLRSRMVLFTWFQILFQGTFTHLSILKLLMNLKGQTLHSGSIKSHIKGIAAGKLRKGGIVEYEGAEHAHELFVRSHPELHTVEVDIVKAVTAIRKLLDKDIAGGEITEEYTGLMKRSHLLSECINYSLAIGMLLHKTQGREGEMSTYVVAPV